MAESRELEDFDGRGFSYCLISRKCRLHVGPRYKARGLNEMADPGASASCCHCQQASSRVEQVSRFTHACARTNTPPLTGNEIECEQIVWRHTEAGKPTPWSRYTWRRGSVPLWWTVTIRNGGMGEAEIRIRNTNTFRCGEWGCCLRQQLL